MYLTCFVILLIGLTTLFFTIKNKRSLLRDLAAALLFLNCLYMIYHLILKG